MGNTGRDPVDHARTTRKRAGETMKRHIWAEHPEADSEPPTA